MGNEQRRGQQMEAHISQTAFFKAGLLGKNTGGEGLGVLAQVSVIGLG